MTRETWKRIAAGGAALVLAAGAFGVLTGFGGGGCFGHGPHGRSPEEISAFVSGRVDGLLDDVNATPAQRDRVQTVVKELVAEGTKLRGDHEGTHAELLAQWNAENPDATKLHALVDQRADAMRTFAHRAVDAALEIHATLTPEQRAALAKKLEAHHGGRW